MQFNITYLRQKDFLFNTIFYLSLHLPSPPPFSFIPQTVVFFVNCFHIIVLFVLYSYLFILIISTFCDKFTKEKALDKTNLFFGLIHEPIMQLNYGQWLICLSIDLFAVLYVHIFGSEINLNLKI